jgi:hypothetical protein
MAILSKGIDFSTGEQITADKLDALVDSATFVGGAVDNSTTQLSGGAIIVKDGGITTNKIASGVNISFNSGSAGSPSITHNGDTNTGIFFGTDAVGIACAGQSPAVFLLNGQGGELQISDFTNNSNLIIGNFNGTGRILKTGTSGLEVGTTGAGSLKLFQNYSAVVTITGGNVGIGTNSPANKLDVNGGITVSDGVRGGMKYGALLIPADANQTSLELTGIPNWAKRITVVFRNLRTNGTAFKQFQLGSSSGYTTTIGGMTEFTSNATVSSTITTGLGLRSDLAADILHGTAVFTLLHGTTWVGSVNFSLSNGGGGGIGNCYIDYANVDRIRLTTVGGSNKFDTGTALGIYYEG